MDMADLENGFRSYEKAVVHAASRCTYEEAMTLRDAYAKLAQTMQDVASATAGNGQADEMSRAEWVDFLDIKED